MIPLFLKRAMLAGVFACAGLASNASAQTWTEIVVLPDEAFYNQRIDLAATPGQVLRYNIHTPADITQLRIELTGDNGNGNLKVYRDSTNAVPACDGRQPGTNERCTLGWTAKTPAANWLIEVSSGAAFTGAKLYVAFIPKLVPVELPDMPYGIARRHAFATAHDAPTSCLQLRTGAPGIWMRAAPCMPVGGQQIWDFHRRPKSYRIENPLTGRCLAADTGGWVQDRPCNELDEEQGWNVLGVPGGRYFNVLQHQASGKCASFNDDSNAAMLVACRIGEADMPGWALLEPDERVGIAQAEDGATFSQAASALCIGDSANGAVLTRCDDRAATRRNVIPALFKAPDNLDLFSQKFFMTAADKDRCIAIDPAAGDIVFRKCDPFDPAQEWTIELYATAIAEWQLRSVQRKTCLTTKGGAITAGTPLALADCGIADTKMRWRYVGH